MIRSHIEKEDSSDYNGSKRIAEVNQRSQVFDYKEKLREPQIMSTSTLLNRDVQNKQAFAIASRYLNIQQDDKNINKVEIQQRPAYSSN